MTCGTCAHWKPGPMSAHGFAACAYGPNYEYLPMDNTCKRHVRLEAAKLAQRQAWLKKKGVK